MLSSEQIGNLVKIGVRAVENPEKYVKGDLVATYSLVPMSPRGDWIREHAREIKSSWEGSFIPLLMYRSGVADILVDHQEVQRWNNLIEKLEAALGIKVIARGD
jgi:hypothetical protein